MIINNKYKLGQTVSVNYKGKRYNGKVEKIFLSEVFNIVYGVKVEINNEVFKRIVYLNVFEKEINIPINRAKEYKKYDVIESRKKVERLFGESVNQIMRVLQIEVDGNEVRLHCSPKNKFEPTIVVSRCHPEDKFDEVKGIEACILKYNIKLMKDALSKL